jgi:hypothetical protein
MAAGTNDRNRMIVDLPSDVQMAIRLRAVKTSTTTGDVVCQAVQKVFSTDVQEARAVLAQHQEEKPSRRQKS